jgi:hypothetical protein
MAETVYDSLAFQRFVKIGKMETADTIRIANSTGATARKLLFESPIRHFRELVWPNVKRPFSGEDIIYANCHAGNRPAIGSHSASANGCKPESANQFPTKW